MESDDCKLINSNHKMDIKKEIKEEPNERLTQFKCEYNKIDELHSEIDFVSSHFLKECSTDSEMCNKIEIKDEPCWFENKSTEITQEMELPFAADAVLKNERKDTSSNRNVITGDIAEEEFFRLPKESLCRKNDTDSCFFMNKNSVENHWKNNDPNIIGASQLLTSNQLQKFEEPSKEGLLDVDVNSVLIQSCKTIYKCEICNESFSQLLELKDHKLIHNDKKQYTCKICNKSFSHAYKLKNHKLIHEGKRPYTCEVCNKSFTQISNLNKHKLIHEEKKLYVCEICNKSFIQASTLKQHKLMHEGKRPYTCEVCNRKFTRATSLKKHKLLHKGKKPYTCESCNKGFTHVFHLSQHKLIHDGKKPYTCEICNKSFTKASNLKQHKLIHDGGRPHKCDICNKRFTQASHLNDHKLIHLGKRLDAYEILKSALLNHQN